MKNIRYLAALLLVITGVLHIAGYITAPHDPGSLGMLAFGIIYGVTGLLLFTPRKYAVYMGLIFPIIGMTIAIIKFGVKDLGYMMTLLLLIDVVVIVCCAYLLLSRGESKS